MPSASCEVNYSENTDKGAQSLRTSTNSTDKTFYPCLHFLLLSCFKEREIKREIWYVSTKPYTHTWCFFLNTSGFLTTRSLLFQGIGENALV